MGNLQKKPKKKTFKTSARLSNANSEMQNTWLSEKYDEVQSYANYNDIKRSSNALKDVYRPQTFGSSQFFSADGSLVLV